MVEAEDSPNLEQTRYILFDAGSTRCATPLLSVREIVQPIAYQKVSNPYQAFLGLANLRGQIIGVLDFGLCLGLDPVDGASESKLIIFDGGDTNLGILVNAVYSPVIIAAEDIVNDPLTDVAFPAEALLGIAKVGAQIIPVVSLSLLAHSLATRG